MASRLPCVDLRAGAAAWVDRQLLLQVVAAVEAEAVALAAGGALQLLQQEDDGVVDDAHHPRAAHPAQRQLLQVEARSGLQDAVCHRTPGDWKTESGNERRLDFQICACRVARFEADVRGGVLPSMLLA